MKSNKGRRTKARTPKFKEEKLNSTIEVGDWVIGQDSSGKLVISHLNGDSIILASPPHTYED